MFLKVFRQQNERIDQIVILYNSLRALMPAAIGLEPETPSLGPEKDGLFRKA